MLIRLNEPSNAPNFCFEVEDVNSGRTVFIQHDWDYIGVARSFGWNGDDLDFSAAYDFLNNNIGATAEDPGYFT